MRETMTTKMAMIIDVIIKYYLRRNAPRGEHLGHNTLTALTSIILQVYMHIGVTLDRTLSYKAHRKYQKESRNKKQHHPKLRTSKWEATPTTLRSSALALR